MNKGKLEKFAVDSRQELIDKIKIKAMQYGIEEDKIKKFQAVSSDSVVINGRPLSNEEKSQREKLIKKIESINKKGENGYNQIVEEVTYTWFNRFTALRFMEINNYLPTRVRALSSETPGNVEPDLIKEASNVDLPVDKHKIYDMKLNNDTEGLFKYLIIAQCNSLNKVLPFMFEKIGHYTELLFPDGLLNDNAFIRNLTNTDIISEEDWQEVEIIGWLYQYYNFEKKNKVIKAKKKYKKEEIPFVTQLFTPDWIVRYMVQNTLGRHWIESHSEHSELKKNWEYYLENSNQESDFEEKLAPYIDKELKVEDIKCFDPACGSGHILVYMFDVLYEIYEKCGYIGREIPRYIIENNIYGLDIDDRAYQLACFAVIMKGMKYNNRLLRSIEREGIKVNIASIQETNNLNDMDIEYIVGESSGENYNKTKTFVECFKNAKIYGSLIKLEGFDKKFLQRRWEHISSNPVEKIEYQASQNNQVDELLEKLIKQADIMTRTYDILVTNPPYMGSKSMNEVLMNFIKTKYPDTKSDLFSAFIDYSLSRVQKNGQLGFMTPFVWMFIKSYESLRKKIINEKNISTLIQLEYSGFEEATVPICTFTIRNSYSELSGEYIKLSNFKGAENQSIKTLEAVKNSSCGYRYTTSAKIYELIPENAIAYWVSNKSLNTFSEGKKLSSFAELKFGLTTANNERFVRKWFEVDNDKISYPVENRNELNMLNKKWFPYNNGGAFRRWYGNNEDLVNWENNGLEIHQYNNIPMDYKGAPVRNKQYYFDEGLTWTSISSSKISFRDFRYGFIFSSAGFCLYCKKEIKNYLNAFLNCSVAGSILQMLTPTLNFNVGDISNLPIIYDDNNIESINKLVNDNIRISRDDWDSYELSWDFGAHPFMKTSYKRIEDIYNIVKQNKENDFNRMKTNEELLNKIFIDIYGLNDEIMYEVSEKNISVSKANREKNIKSFISYAVGCMFGRYSLDKEGLIYAGGKFDSSKYNVFKVDEDNIIPILSENYFEDDIVSKFVEFVNVAFGEEILSENLEYIAETLGKKSNETAKETIRRYFLTDFYKDHLQTYKNRPIYWMFTSGKQKAFNCLIYMHRYDKTTLSRIRTDYLHELQDRLDTERKSLADVIEGDYSTKEKSDAKKKLTPIDKQIDELKKYDEVLHHMADMQIEIDLDDGVKVNYEKFKGLLAKI